MNKNIKNITNAMLDVVDERHRQVNEEGWTTTLDDRYEYGELAKAAACYACEAIKSDYLRRMDAFSVPMDWPWAHDSWKPKDPRRDLVRAAALLIAEIERLDRISEVQSEGLP